MSWVYTKLLVNMDNNLFVNKSTIYFVEWPREIKKRNG